MLNPKNDVTVGKFNLQMMNFPLVECIVVCKKTARSMGKICMCKPLNPQEKQLFRETEEYLKKFQ